MTKITVRLLICHCNLLIFKKKRKKKECAVFLVCALVASNTWDALSNYHWCNRWNIMGSKRVGGPTHHSHYGEQRSSNLIHWCLYPKVAVAHHTIIWKLKLIKAYGAAWDRKTLRALTILSLGSSRLGTVDFRGVISDFPVHKDQRMNF